MRSSGKQFAGAVFGSLALPIFRIANRNSVRILMYHRFRGFEEQFARQCDHLMRHYRPVSLESALRDGQDNAVVITIDDGYGDVYTSAFPILRARGIPALVFLVTDFLDGRCWIWTEQVRYVVEHSGAAEVHAAGTTYSLQDREAAIGAIKKILKMLPDRERIAAMEEMQQSAGVRIPETPPAGDAPLTWGQVREMARSGIEFGGHTRRHPILSRVASTAELRDEIFGCKTRIEEELQMRTRHFCYPNGGADDINEEVVRVTREAGYETAVSTLWGSNRPEADPFMLRRYGVDPGVPADWFDRVVAGAARG
jgi:peptidoglycan/xylan/chitin deacetylase (PgdA/CDA1 family)